MDFKEYLKFIKTRFIVCHPSQTYHNILNFIILFGESFSFDEFYLKIFKRCQCFNIEKLINENLNDDKFISYEFEDDTHNLLFSEIDISFVENNDIENLLNNYQENNLIFGMYLFDSIIPMMVKLNCVKNHYADLDAYKSSLKERIFSYLFVYLVMNLDEYEFIIGKHIIKIYKTNKQINNIDNPISYSNYVWGNFGYSMFRIEIAINDSFGKDINKMFQ